MKAKFGRGVAQLTQLEGGMAALGSAPAYIKVGGLPVEPFTQVKLRGALTPRAAALIGAAVCAIPTVTTVKLARYWAVEDAAGTLAAALCAAGAAGEGTRTLTLSGKKKGAEPFSSEIGAVGTDAAAVEAGIVRCSAASP